MLTLAQNKFSNEDITEAMRYRNDWNLWIEEILGVNLDFEQRRIVTSVQNNRRTSVRSGNTRGKDYVAAALGLFFLYNYCPSKVIITAPTDRQVVNILMAEISSMWTNAKIKLGGDLLTSKIQLPEKTWYLLGFKAKDKNMEAWSGFHSENIFVIVSEASGIAQETFDAIEGILTATVSRELLVFNPTISAGEAYKSTKSPLYVKHKLNCLDAPNVIAKKIIIPGQVDYPWVIEKIEKWCLKIKEDSGDPVKHDFKFEEHWYRPNDLFMIKVMGEYAVTSDTQLIPLEWVELANERWRQFVEDGGKPKGELRLGADIAGEGRDSTVFLYRYVWKEKINGDSEPDIYKEYDFVEKCESFFHQDHMLTAEKLQSIHSENGKNIYIDAIGEGAGVHSRLKQLLRNTKSKSYPVKFSEGVKGLTDLTKERKFNNMRTFCYWAVRDALDPNFGAHLMLPPIDELTQDLTEIQTIPPLSNGEIRLEPKENIKTRLGRSTDWGDPLAQTYYPKRSFSVKFI